MDIKETQNEKKMSNVFYIYVNLQVEIFRKVHKEIVQILLQNFPALTDQQHPLKIPKPCER